MIVVRKFGKLLFLENQKIIITFNASVIGQDINHEQIIYFIDFT